MVGHLIPQQFNKSLNGHLHINKIYGNEQKVEKIIGFLRVSEVNLLCRCSTMRMIVAFVPHPPHPLLLVINYNLSTFQATCCFINADFIKERIIRLHCAQRTEQPG